MTIVPITIREYPTDPISIWLQFPARYPGKRNKYEGYSPEVPAVRFLLSITKGFNN